MTMRNHRSFIDIEDDDIRIQVEQHSKVENYGRSHWFISIRHTRNQGAMRRLRPAYWRRPYSKR